MAECIPFDGMNRHVVPADEAVGEVMNIRPTMYGFNNNVITYTRWELTPEEIMEIAKTGEVWVATRYGNRPMLSTWVGSRSTIKGICACMGGLWKRRPKMIEDKREMA